MLKLFFKCKGDVTLNINLFVYIYMVFRNALEKIMKHHHNSEFHTTKKNQSRKLKRVHN